MTGGAGPVDQMDDDRLRGGARADRGDGLVTAHASADGVAWEPGWVATLTPFSVDGMIVAASTTLQADSRSGNRGGACCVWLDQCSWIRRWRQGYS